MPPGFSMTGECNPAPESRRGISLRFLLFLLLVPAVSHSQSPPLCVPTGFRVYIPKFSVEEIDYIGGDWYRQIPVGVFQQAFQGQLKKLRLFREVTTDSTGTIDLILKYEILNLERSPRTSTEDLEATIRVTLQDPLYQQTIWAGDYIAVAEVHTIGEGSVQALTLPYLLANGVVADLLPRLAQDLNRFFTLGGLARFAYYSSDFCVERTPVELRFKNVPTEFRNATLRAFSEMACFALVVSGEESDVATKDGDLLLTVEMGDLNDSLTLLASVPGQERLWKTSALSDFVGSLEEGVRFLTEYHHREFVCTHERFYRGLLGRAWPDERFVTPGQSDLPDIR